MNAIEFAERGWLPDWLIRLGVRRLLAQRLQHTGNENLVDELRRSPLAVNTNDANDQHYEVPAEFFSIVLGPRLKYSCCLFAKPSISLADAEQEMLRMTCERA